MARALGFQASTETASKIPRFLKHPQLAGESTGLIRSICSSLTLNLALPYPTPERGCNVKHPAIHWLNDDLLLGIFNCYRLDVNNDWNVQLGWRKLSHVCQRWRHLIYECAFYLGMHIKCTNGTPIFDTLVHLPLLPLFVDYQKFGFRGRNVIVLTKQDELWRCTIVCDILT